VVDLVKLKTGAGRALLSVFVAPTGVLGYQNNVTRQGTYGNVPVTRGIWHSLEVRLHVGRGPGKAQAWLDGYTVGKPTKAPWFGKTPIRLIQLGEDVRGRTYAVAFDDILAAAWNR
jgi:hypothetical protein